MTATVPEISTVAYYDDGQATVLHGDCLTVLPTLEANSVDAVICDPPYALEFQGADWDGANGFRRSLNAADAGRDSVFGRTSRTSPEYRTGTTSDPLLFQNWCQAWALECLRVLKPGGHLVAFGAPRTYHRLTSGIEDAGFQIRDSITWLFATGMVKSRNLYKYDIQPAVQARYGDARCTCPDSDTTRTLRLDGDPDQDAVAMVCSVCTLPAQVWLDQLEGTGTTLKPAAEPIVVARKPLDGTVAHNMLHHGTGALNIDACRVAPTGESRDRDGEATAETRYTTRGGTNFAATPGVRGGSPKGRWPSNVVLDEGAAASLDEQSGILTSGAVAPGGYKGEYNANVYGTYAYSSLREETVYADSGGASRFYPVFRYQAKAPQSERPVVGGVHHPTQKPLSLLRWISALFVAPGGLVLDPFLGSGTTAEACLLEGRRCVGIEREAQYLPLIRARIERAGQGGTPLPFDVSPCPPGKKAKDATTKARQASSASPKQARSVSANVEALPLFDGQ